MSRQKVRLEMADEEKDESIEGALINGIEAVPELEALGDISNSAFILKVLQAQNAKTRRKTLEELGTWLKSRGVPGQDGSYPHFVRVELSEIEALIEGDVDFTTIL